MESRYGDFKVGPKLGPKLIRLEKKGLPAMVPNKADLDVPIKEMYYSSKSQSCDKVTIVTYLIY